MATEKQEASQIKSKERVAQRGEVFTAEREVNAMLDLVEHECLRPDSRFLEPACGDGNFLSAILKRKLTELRRKYKKSARDYEKLSIVAISIYTHKGQGIAIDYIAVDYEASRLTSFVRSISLTMSSIFFIPNREQAIATCLYIVIQNINTIQTTDGYNRLSFVVISTVFVFTSEFGKFASENDAKEIAIATSWLKETRVRSKAFGCHKVAHSIHLTLGSEHLASLCHTLL